MLARSWEIHGEPGSAQTLTSVLDERALRVPEQVIYRFLRDDGTESATLSLGELRRGALAIAQQLEQRGLRGERAILMYPQGLAFLTAFFGCLYAGVVAVPASVPNRKRGVEIVERVARDAKARVLLTNGQLLERSRGDSLGGSLNSVLCVNTDETPFAEVEGVAMSPRAPHEVALLQFTSGTTGSPRGVMVTHGNLTHNQSQVSACLAAGNDAKYVSWLPMFHDMGLGIALQAVWLGAETILMPPRSFIHEPALWLSTISRYRATISGGPNFAYEHCVQRVTERAKQGLDLSSWQVAFNGSEPVNARTLERFARVFGECGFRYQSFQPVYGLAEATLAVSSEPPSHAPLVRHFDRQALARGQARPVSPAAGKPLVSCGRPWPGTALLVVHPDTHEPCPPRTVGEVWIFGPSVTQGYFERDAETRACFDVHAIGTEGRYLRSGDLGFMDAGSLFLTGRRHEVVIVDGRTYYPQDIEGTVSECHPALADNASAVFGSRQGQGLGVVQEVSRRALRNLDAEAVMRQMRHSVAEQHGLVVEAIELIKPGTLPRTTSGKVQRAKAQQGALERSLASVASWRRQAPGLAVAQRATSPRPHTPSPRAASLIDWLGSGVPALLESYEGTALAADRNALLFDLAKLGVFGLRVDQRYGGLGFGQLDAARVLEQLGALDFRAAIASTLNECLGILPIARHASDELKPWLVPALVRGEQFAGFARVEAPETAPLRRESLLDAQGELRLSGSGGFDAVLETPGLMNVFSTEGGHAFVVGAGDFRFESARQDRAQRELGFARGVVTFEAALGHRLGQPGCAGAIQQQAWAELRLGLAAACVGGLRRLMRAASRVTMRVPTSSKRTPNPATLARLGSIKARETALACLVQRIALALDAGRFVSAEAFAACSLLGPELLLRSSEDLLKLGITFDVRDREQAVSSYRDAALLQHHDGPLEDLAERTGLGLLDNASSLATALERAFGAQGFTARVERVARTVRTRASHLKAPLARRAQRWANTRAGELTASLSLLCALEGAERSHPHPEFRHARLWAEARLESALNAVRFGTPAEVAALDTHDAPPGTTSTPVIGSVSA